MLPNFWQSGDGEDESYFSSTTTNGAEASDPSAPTAFNVYKPASKGMSASVMKAPESLAVAPIIIRSKPDAAPVATMVIDSPELNPEPQIVVSPPVSATPATRLLDGEVTLTDAVTILTATLAVLPSAPSARIVPIPVADNGPVPLNDAENAPALLAVA